MTYDADGDLTGGPLNGAMTAFSYNAKGLLTGAGGITYQYDAAGNRIGVTDSVYGTTSYVVDPNATLSQVLISTNASGNQTYYVYGLGLIGQEDANGYKVYHFDLRGSTVALTDQDGKVTDTFQYGLYGSLVSHRGTTSTPFEFIGQYGVMTDPNGLLFMRARYYDPDIARFLSKDTILQNITQMVGSNAYSYAGNNPAQFIDPTGHNWWTVALGGVAVVAGVVAVAVTSPELAAGAAIVGGAAVVASAAVSTYQYATGKIGPAEFWTNIGADALGAFGAGFGLAGKLGMEVAPSIDGAINGTGLLSSQVLLAVDITQSATGEHVFPAPSHLNEASNNGNPLK